MLIDRLARDDLYIFNCTKGFDLGHWVVAFALPVLMGNLAGIPRLL